KETCFCGNRPIGGDTMEQMATIGKVIGTHGVKGNLKVQPFSDFPQRITTLARVFVGNDEASTVYKVLEAFVNGRFWVVRLESVTDMAMAEKLKGTMLMIPLTERVKLPANAYYLDQIIGLTVFTMDGLRLGEVKDVLKTGSNDVYVVQQDQGQDILIPALKTVVKNIDLENARVNVDLPEGLL
ncbi:MAG: ribosome maturation factor RimM, partial [Firmicutes bacterium]|nr:ribosome maturation factor RimM [Bacillota bacterium]